MRILTQLAFILVAMVACQDDPGSQEALHPLVETARQFQRSDGTMDFVAAVNAHCGDGVTPQNNAAVELLFTMPFDEIAVGEEWYTAALDQMNVQRPDGFPHFVPYDNLAGDDRAAAEESERAMRQPWSEDETSRVNRWLGINAEALAMIEKGTRKPRFFVPFLTESGDSQDLLLQIVLPHARHSRAVAHAFAIRATQRCAEGRLNDAWKDILTLQRLAARIGDEPLAISSLVSFQIAAETSTLIERLAISDKLTSAFCKTAIAELQNLRPDARVEGAIDLGERAFILDCTQRVENIVHMIGSDIDQALQRRIDAWRRIYDQTEAMSDVNELFDQFVETTRSSDFRSVESQLEAFEKNLEARSIDPEGNILALVGGGIDERNEKHVQQAITNGFICLGIPALHVVVHAKWVAETRHDLRLITLALGGFRAEQGRWPGSLDELSPDFLDQIPVDRFLDQPLHYRADGGTVSVWAAGVDQADDGGNTETDIVMTLDAGSN